MRSWESTSQMGRYRDTGHSGARDGVLGTSETQVVGGVNLCCVGAKPHAIILCLNIRLVRNYAGHEWMQRPV